MVGLSTTIERRRMSAKCPCQNCNVHIEFEAAQAGQTVVCPKCGMDTLLFISPVQPTRAARPSPHPVFKKPMLTPLEGLRANTAYPGGRRVMNILFGASLIGAIIGIFGGVLSSGPAQGILIAVSIGSFISGWAAWEIANAIFDMADCALRRPATDGKKNPV